MPYRSKRQQRLFFVLQREGRLKPGTALQWAHETPNIRRLPEHVSDRRDKHRRRRRAATHRRHIRRAHARRRRRRD